MATSPDLTPYVDLTLFDRDAQDVVEVALADLQSKMPTWRPDEVNTESLLIESVALEVEEEVFAINRLPSATIEGLLRLIGVDRDLGQAPEATLLFTVGDTVGHLIPEGTRVLLTLAGGLDPVVLSTTADLQIAPGVSVGVVAAEGDRLTAEANGYAIGTLVELLDAIAYVDSVSLASVPAAGRDEEDQDAWLSRGVRRFARLSGTLNRPPGFRDAALELGAFRALALDNYDPALPGVPASPDVPDGNARGHMTVAVYGENDVPLTEAAKDDLLGLLDALSQANLIPHVVDPTVTAVDVTAQVRVLPGFDGETVRAAVAAALRGYLSPNAWPWEPVVRRSQLITIANRVAGVAFAEVSLPADNVLLPGVAPLTRPGTVTVELVAA